MLRLKGKVISFTLTGVFALTLLLNFPPVPTTSELLLDPRAPNPYIYIVDNVLDFETALPMVLGYDGDIMPPNVADIGLDDIKPFPILPDRE
jgi:hypothetical protein